MRRRASFSAARRRNVLVGDAKPLDLTTLARAPHEVHVRCPETFPAFAFRQVRQQRRARRGFEWFLRAGAADEMHGDERSIVGSFDGVAVCGDGNLENPNSKRNSKVFHKSLRLLWIAIVEICR